MLGKIIGAVAGKKVAEQTGAVGGTSGALLGVGAAALARRLGPVGLVAAAAGGYAIKRYLEKREQAAGPRTASEFA